MSLNHCYQFWSNTVNLYSKLGFFRFISVFGVGHQSKLTRDVIPSCINILLAIHPIETRETAYHHQAPNQHHPTCASLSRAWRDQETKTGRLKPKKRRRGVSSSINQSSSSSSMSPETGIDLQDRPECVCTDFINHFIPFTLINSYDIVVYPH